MSLDKQQAHRPGAYKQVNKAHKHGRHRSKGSVSADNKGKVGVKLITKRQKADLNREQRRHQSNQIRSNKREEILAKKRKLGRSDTAPFLVCVLPLQQHIDPETALSILKQCDSEANISKSPTGVTHISIPRFKQRYSFVIPPLDSEFAILDTMKVCDTVLFLISAAGAQCAGDGVIDDWGSNILQTCKNQKLPSTVVAVTDLESVNPKKRNEHKQNIQKFVSKYLPDEKIMPLDKFSDAVNIIRKIGNQNIKDILYRDRRPHLYAEQVEFVPDSEGDEGVLKVTGYLRGANLCVNSLVHIIGLGDFQMAQIDAPYDPHPLDHKKANKQVITEDNKVVVRVLARCDPEKQESLQSEAIPDEMDAEQTMPTDEEIAMAQAEQKGKKKAPKGWSDYQASWIPEGDDADFNDSNDEGDEDDYVEAIDDGESVHSGMEEGGNIDFEAESEIGANDQRYDEGMDMEEEKAALEKLKAAKDDLEFPDEIDTPNDLPARIRFQKYRALESFRKSKWDPLENLPVEYGRIFQFVSFNRVKHQVLKAVQEMEASAEPGWYITIHLKGVSKVLWNTFSSAKSPVVLFGMFPTEHKMSVLHTVLTRTPNYNEPIKSKERLIFQCGYRRFIVNPIFSEHTNGEKHKFERFFQSSSTTVATFYAPIQFPPAPVLCYKEIDNRLVLVAVGRLHTHAVTPTRLIVKRVVLSGHPFKVHKNSAVVRFMFFNREDIQYFSVCRLRTKYGLEGFIKEPLGTHGHMKCVFKASLKSQDTVLLYLYKRVFPKWTYENLVVSCPDENQKMES